MFQLAEIGARKKQYGYNQDQPLIFLGIDMKKYRLIIKKYVYENKALATTTALAVLFLLLWLISAQEIKWSDLFLNLLACFITSSITIGVIDRIIRKSEEEKILPIRQSIYRDVQIYLSRIIRLWEEMYIQSHEDRDNIAIEQLFSEVIIDRIISSLDLEGSPNVIPRQNWFTYIEHSALEMETLSEKILTRYNYNLPPELIQMIHNTMTDCAFSGDRLRLVSSVYRSDKRNHLPRIPTLQHYLVCPQESDYEVIHRIIEWCRKEYKELKETGDHLYPIIDKVHIINPQSPPSSILTSEKISKKCIEYDEWVKTTSKLI